MNDEEMIAEKARKLWHAIVGYEANEALVLRMLREAYEDGWNAGRNAAGESK
jgi:hypothetical protein